MDGQDIVAILNRMSEVYTGGAYPGRNSEGLNPEWPCDPFHVLIATILSQRTKDDNTRKASDALFNRYPTLESIAGAEPGDIAPLIRPAGFPNQKAKAIVNCCRMIIDEFGSEVPESTEELCSLPMVGRKTAACVRSYAMMIPSVCVDTHVHRISNLMGLVRTDTPEETEYALMAITPEDRWSDINRYFVRHGQECCIPNRPRCGKCMVRDMCQYGSSHDPRQCSEAMVRNRELIRSSSFPHGSTRLFITTSPIHPSMHEASVMADIVDAVLEELGAYRVTKVNDVTIRVGDLTQLGEEQLQFAWEILTDGNILKGSRLVVEHEPVTLSCPACGYDGPARNVDFGSDDRHGIPLLSCPVCNGKVEVTGGTACRIVSFDIEEE